MTSSLVGSEMCIRDRQKAIGSFKQCLCQHKMLKQRCELQQTGGTSEAVSYTHLTLPTICSV
eukprot:3870926-Prorocentrum_lima.AAC.1